MNQTNPKISSKYMEQRLEKSWIHWKLTGKLIDNNTVFNNYFLLVFTQEDLRNKLFLYVWGKTLYNISGGPIKVIWLISIIIIVLRSLLFSKVLERNARWNLGSCLQFFFSISLLTVITGIVLPDVAPVFIIFNLEDKSLPTRQPDISRGKKY